MEQAKLVFKSVSVASLRAAADFCNAGAPVKLYYFDGVLTLMCDTYILDDEYYENVCIWNKDEMDVNKLYPEYILCETTPAYLLEVVNMCESDVIDLFFETGAMKAVVNGQSMIVATVKSHGELGTIEHLID